MNRTPYTHAWRNHTTTATRIHVFGKLHAMDRPKHHRRYTAFIALALSFAAMMAFGTPAIEFLVRHPAVFRFAMTPWVWIVALVLALGTAAAVTAYALCREGAEQDRERGE